MKTKNLTIQEAIQSGLPFKREDWTHYRSSTDLGNECNLFNTDILATDWEIKVPELTITREKLIEEYKNAYTYAYPIGTPDEKILSNLIKRLGL